MWRVFIIRGNICPQHTHKFFMFACKKFTLRVIFMVIPHPLLTASQGRELLEGIGASVLAPSPPTAWTHAGRPCTVLAPCWTGSPLFSSCTGEGVGGSDAKWNISKPVYPQSYISSSNLTSFSLLSVDPNSAREDLLTSYILDIWLSGLGTLKNGQRLAFRKQNNMQKI